MWRVTFYFQVERYTWTESHYLPQGGSTASVSAVMATLAALRCGLLSVNATIQAIRIENLTPPRTVYYLQAGTFQSVGSFNTGGSLLGPDNESAPPWAAVKVRVQGVAGYSSTIYISGIPEGIVGTGGLSIQNLEPSAPFGNALTAYLNGLIAASASFRVRQLVSPIQPVTLVSQPAQAGGNIAVQTTAPLVFGTPPNFGPAKSAIVLKGFRRGNLNLPGLSGVYYIDSGSPGIQSGAATPYIYWLEDTGFVAPSNIIQKGGASGLVFYYDTFAILNPRGATHRKRGASALAPRGRSRTRR
jgi:hypothetical protein